MEKKEYCTGCGLCENFQLCKLDKDSKGYLYPEEYNDELETFAKKICPFTKKRDTTKLNSIWGNYHMLYKGYSNDEYIRTKASSGGVLTEICIYLLKNKLIDGVIQTTYDRNNPMQNVTTCSTSMVQIVNCSGSRYASSNPLRHLNKLVVTGKKYAFVGKPCDIIALRNYIKEYGYLKNEIKYFFSFFCAGVPSDEANKKLLEKMGCNINECMSLNYRGDGWPGFTKATDINGKEYQLDYNSSWMNFLGRDIRKCCKFCFDSIGEASDISCGDFWNLTVDNKPDFSNSDGINAVFSWTDVGDDLIKQLRDDGIIHLETYSKIEEELIYAQPNHRSRRSTMLSRLIALKLFGLDIPSYSCRTLISASKYSDILYQLKSFKGTVDRIRKNNI
ncbi:MAG: Coenzyme F420 hydrogenase/dehydrogenase, beta subunit C-terminal domain [Lachnospiraceae bacterium]|nr:Coenzyme F420 hydrogenase/dehydrogenase, beta subunit C-terminal domain [Lachnospiraceae bacterium]